MMTACQKGHLMKTDEATYKSMFKTQSENDEKTSYLEGMQKE